MLKPKRFFSLLMTVVFLILLITPAFSADNEKTVKVGYMDYNGFINKNDDGSFSGYGAEYLQKISEITGYKYEYVYADWSELIRMLQNKEIDLLCTAQYTQERALTFDYSSYPIGYTQGLLYAVADSDICYADYASFNGMKIGAVKNSAMNEIFAFFAQQKGFTYSLTEYATESEMLNALNDGSIDAMCSESLANHAGLSLLADFGADAYYIISYKGSPYISEIDNALQMIKTDVDFESTLYHKYYDSSSAATAVSFTTEEKEYISNCGTIRVGLNLSRAPFSQYDEKTKTFTGINIDVLNEISRITGIEFEFVPMTAGMTVPDLFTTGNYDLICGIERDNFLGSSSIASTDAFLESAIVPVGRKGENIDLNSSITVTFPSSFMALKKQIEAEYPNLTIKTYSDNRACLDAVVSGEADVLIQNTHIMSILLQEPKYADLSLLPVRIMTEHTAMAMPVSDSAMLLSIMNKAISGMDKTIVSNSLIKHTFATPYKMTFADFLYKFKVQITLISILVIACFTLLIVLIIVRRKSENSLKKKNVQLGEAIAQANEANDAKGLFLARMSHEIRTPMNAIVGLTAIAKNHLEEPVRINDYLNKIDSSSKILLNIINDVLDMSAIENKKLKIAHQSFDIKEILSAITTVYYAQCSQKGVALEVMSAEVEHEILIGDPLRVNQILLNLVSNAYKFTEKGGTIKIELSELSQRDQTVFIRIKVSDTGIGMTDDMLSRLFKNFEQEDAQTAQKHGGSGLGLSITKNLVELMHGTISVKSKKDVGTEFTVDLPFEVAEETAKINKEKLNSIHALVVDDDKHAREYTAIVLSRIGVNFDVAESGDEAVKMLKEKYDSGNGYDICFIDWKMPDMNGVEVTKKIREDFDNDTVVIIVSAYDLSEVEDEAKAAGANMFVSKPLFQSTVFNVIMSLSGGVVHSSSNDGKYDFSGKRVLLAEDNALNTEIAVEILKMASLEIDTAENGQQAFEKFLNSAPGTYEAILMDIQMPIMNGYEATKAIRESNHSQAKTIPILAMTANAFDEDVTASLSAGMNGHISKPIDTMDLYKQLQQQFDKNN